MLNDVPVQFNAVVYATSTTNIITKQHAISVQLASKIPTKTIAMYCSILI